MHTADAVQRVRIYMSDADVVGGRPLYLATLDLLRESGATGATALRAIAGFGVSQGSGVTRGDSGQALPVVIEWIDRAERVARVLPALDALLPNALITLEPVQVYRATLRSSGPFGERVVGELAVRDVVSTTAQVSLVEAGRLLLDSRQDLLPVLDGGGRLIGALGEAELRRQNIPSLARLRAAAEDEQNAILAQLPDAALVDVINTELLALTADSSVLQAANAMVEWGINQVPVITREGRFAGLFGVEQALQAALDARPASDSPIRDADGPAPISLLMQGAMQTVLGYTPAAQAVERLLTLRDQPLIVVDNGRPLGVLDLDTLFSATELPLRAALRSLAEASPPEVLATLAPVLGETRVASLPLAALPPMPVAAGYDQAIALFNETGATWIAAVDEYGKIQGLVGRRTILRALVQESAR